MIRYRIDRDEDGRYFVLPAFLQVVPISETYLTRKDAQEMADWLNQIAASEEAETAAL